jgi:hypothetical protein
MIGNFEFDVFIAYASPDAAYAKRLYSVLTAVGHSVFLDTESLLGGDPWPLRIKRAQQASLLTVVLISDRFDAAYFQQEEILEAIELAREEGIRRVVPSISYRQTRERCAHVLKEVAGHPLGGRCLFA